MPHFNGLILACFTCMTIFVSASALEAQPPNEVAHAPVPEQILKAKKVFISNLGDDCNPRGAIIFSGGPDRAYDQFYAEIKSWGRYDLEATPAGSDLVFEIRFHCPTAAIDVIKGSSVGPGYDPQLMVAILDPKMHVTLWALYEHVRAALLQANRDKNFDQAIVRLVDDIRNLTAR